ncbi:hypothetical protein GOP47_0017460 [Adiantum capillus-veneris]|uniref:TLDc domain-containing protein n=1 Tax=Adiantum capillus-veneris TaxID=13818 RepID=A0A9D4UFU7_ADICA|nr:hypothetical protein GOP47_0017460 [Adiantum capillus-veneris]
MRIITEIAVTRLQAWWFGGRSCILRTPYLCRPPPRHRPRPPRCPSPLISSAPCALFGPFFRRQDTSPPSSIDGSSGYHLDVPLSFPESLLSNTFLAGRELKCCYKASLDGFGAAVFHEKCDFKGPCVIVGKTEKGVKFGAFNPEGYRSTDDYYDSFEPFLFYWEDDDDVGAPVMLRKVGGRGAALFDYARGGPQFGADGLLIGPPLAPVMGGFSGPDTNSGVGSLTEGKSRLGLSYEKRPDGKDSLFGTDSGPPSRQAHERAFTIGSLRIFLWTRSIHH